MRGSLWMQLHLAALVLVGDALKLDEDREEGSEEVDIGIPEPAILSFGDESTTTGGFSKSHLWFSAFPRRRTTTSPEWDFSTATDRETVGTVLQTFPIPQNLPGFNATWPAPDPFDATVDYDGAISSITKRPEDIWLPSPTPELSQPKKKLAFQPDQPQVIRFSDSDLRDGLPFPGFLIRVLAGGVSTMRTWRRTGMKSIRFQAYKIAISDNRLENYLIPTPPAGEADMPIYLLVTDAVGLAAEFDQKRMDFRVRALYRVDSMICYQVYCRS